MSSETLIERCESIVPANPILEMTRQESDKLEAAKILGEPSVIARVDMEIRCRMASSLFGTVPEARQAAMELFGGSRIDDDDVSAAAFDPPIRVFNHLTGQWVTYFEEIFTRYVVRAKHGEYLGTAYFTSISRLRRPLPYSIILKINELQDLKIFNMFSVVAPSSELVHSESERRARDPYLYASIRPIGLDPTAPEGFRDFKYGRAFYVARWE